MGQDNQPKARQKAHDLRRRAAMRQPIDRLLIVCEGAKTEPHYFGEIRQELRLSTANVQVRHSAFGTDPLSVVKYAEHVFRQGDLGRGIEPREFDRVFVVFDRDDHLTYHSALDYATSLNEKMLNDEKVRVPFGVIASVPCFELWLLLHFEDVHAPIQRDEVYRRLRGHLPGYDKGQDGHWSTTKHLLLAASERAAERTALATAENGEEPFTSVHELVARLIALRQQ